LTRVRATASDYCNLAAYETFTCLKPDGHSDAPRVDRTEDGTVRYDWRRGTPPLTPAGQDKLVKADTLKPEEVLLALQDVDSGKPVRAHAGSVYWNPFRRRWVMITCEQFGTSMLGEVWFAEADSPPGPWVYARKVVTHDKYSFYNPKQHSMLDRGNGRIILFEGTYTHTFSGNPDRTPRYDYNQIMYRLDLADPRLNLPVAVYRHVGEDASVNWATARDLGGKPGERHVAFFALERPRDDAVPVFAEPAARGHVRLKTGDTPPTSRPATGEPCFYALPVQKKPRPTTCVPLFEFVSEDGLRREYATHPEWSKPGFHRAESPLCLVWRNPIRAAISWTSWRPHGKAE
jgi:hypothetical protein